ncbi:hypothetical protein [Actinomadura sp. NPDC000600]|uniref:hypothetical protein n=1 Tax=Actinomadura sp. NPDC000600 TaxID=3154262 RepID=UPI003393483E
MDGSTTLSAKDDRIWFPGNPWPGGHRIEEFAWKGRLDPESGLRFVFELESADYDAEDSPGREEDEDSEDGPDFEAKIVWCNYHSCTISAARGFVAGSPDEPLDFDALTGRAFHVDGLDEVDEIEDWDDFAFHIYLLGHDSVADHRIRFPTRHAPFEFGLEWDGRIALTYVGEEEYKYRFRAGVGRVAFQGFEVPDDLDDKAADGLLKACLRDPERFRLSQEGRERWYVPIS